MVLIYFSEKKFYFFIIAYVFNLETIIFKLGRMVYHPMSIIVRLKLIAWNFHMSPNWTGNQSQTNVISLIHVIKLYF